MLPQFLERVKARPGGATYATPAQGSSPHEAGVKGFAVDTWYGLMAPAGTPAEAIRVLTREAGDFARSPAVRERLANAGLEPQGLCGEPFAAQIGREIEANTRVARELDLKVE